MSNAGTVSRILQAPANRLQNRRLEYDLSLRTQTRKNRHLVQEITDPYNVLLQIHPMSSLDAQLLGTVDDDHTTSSSIFPTATNATPTDVTNQTLATGRPTKASPRDPHPRNVELPFPAPVKSRQCMSGTNTGEMHR